MLGVTGFAAMPDREKESELDCGLLHDGQQQKSFHASVKEERAGDGKKGSFHHIVGRDREGDLLVSVERGATSAVPTCSKRVGNWRAILWDW